MPAFPPTGGGLYIVSVLANLPNGVQDAAVGSVAATNALYQYDAPTNTWNPMGGTGVLLAIQDTNSVDLDLPMANTLNATVRISADAADVGYTIVPINIQGGGSPGLRAQVQNSAITGLFTFSDTNSIDLTNTTGTITADLRLSTNVADVGYTIVSNNIEAAVSLGLRSQILNTSITSLFSVTDTNSINFTYTTGNITGDVRISNNAADVNNTLVSINIEAAGTVGLRAQIPNASITGLISVTDTNSLDLTYTTGVINGDVRISTNAADLNYTIVPIDIQSAASVGLRAQILTADIQSAITVTDTTTVDLTKTAGAISADVKFSSNAADAGFTLVPLNAESLVSQGVRAQVAFATGAVSGTVSTTTQTFAGNKTFTGSVRTPTLILPDTVADAISVVAPAVTATYTLTLPTSGGTNGYVLTTNGSGTTSWQSSVQILSQSAVDLSSGTLTLATTSDAFKFIIEFDTERSSIECSSSYSAAVVTALSDIGNYYLLTDAGTGLYITKSASSNVITIKNRLGGSRTIKVTVLTSGVAVLSAFA